MTSVATLFLSLQCAALRIGSAVAALPLIGQPNPHPICPRHADDLGEDGAVGGEGAFHGAQDACGVPEGQENTVSQMRAGVAHA